MSPWFKKFLLSFVVVFLSFVALGKTLYASEQPDSTIISSPSTGFILEGGVKIFGVNFNRELVQQLEIHLDKVNPLFLAGISAYYYKEKNIDKATFYYQAALLRMNIDAKVIPDNLLDDYPAMITMLLGDFFFEFELTKKLFLQHLDAMLKAKIEVIDWDKKTERNYSFWEIVNQDHEKVTGYIQSAYKEWALGTTDLTNEVMNYKRMLANMPDDGNVSELFNKYFDRLTKENNTYIGDKPPGYFKKD